MRVAMRRSVWHGESCLAAGDIVDVPDDVARQVIAAGAGVEVPDVPGLAPTQEFPATAPLEHREPVVEHRDPPKAKRRGG